MIGRKIISVALVGVILAITGCATNSSRRVAQLEQQVAVTQAENARLQGEVVAAQDMALQGSGELFPPNAEPGECWARAYIPPIFQTMVRDVLVEEASEEVEVLPAEYEWVEELVLVTEESTHLEVIPAEYGWQEEEVLVKPATTVWKRGHGPIERVDDLTGEIMCLIELPAEYNTFNKRVLLRPASTQEVTIPAEYETVRVQKLVSPPREIKIPIPERYETVTEEAKITEGRMEWRPILCETNVTPGLVRRLQSALRVGGYYRGPIDGAYGSETLAAVREFQREQGIAAGQLTLETLTSLDVRP